jgi:hypothetical protein
MKKIQDSWLIVISLVVVFIIAKECSGPPVTPPPVNPPTIDTITYYDTVKVKLDTLVIRDSIRFVDSIRYTDIPLEVDSGAIIRDYFSEVYSTANVIDDSLAKLDLSWMVTRNRVKWIKPELTIHTKTHEIVKVITHPAPDPRTTGFMGLGIGRSPNSFGLAPSFALLTKKSNLYSIQYDVLNKDLYFTMYLTLRLRK